MSWDDLILIIMFGVWILVLIAKRIFSIWAGKERKHKPYWMVADKEDNETIF